MKKTRFIGLALVLAVWLILVGAAWFAPAKDISEAERRKLAQFPTFSTENLLSGKFMTDFESFAQDQFPLRDSFRQMKALFHYGILRQGDNNGIYFTQGYAAALEYPLDEASVQNAGKRLNTIYEKYLAGTGSEIILAVVPDKGYYLAEANGYPAMDYDALFSLVREQLPWADYVDITDCLNIDCYYRTDTHWRQEQILPAAQRICDALGVTAPQAEDFTVTQLERPFYGVYYGQAALPMAAEPMYVLENDLLDQCEVYNFETQTAYSGVYDREKEAGRDMYDVFLSGASPLLTIENPNAATDRELIVFRDSFGSSMVPLLLRDYRTVTVVDTRYIRSEFLGGFLDFHGQDVLLLYSTLLLNSSYSMN